MYLTNSNICCIMILYPIPIGLKIRRLERVVAIEMTDKQYRQNRIDLIQRIILIIAASGTIDEAIEKVKALLTEE